MRARHFSVALLLVALACGSAHAEDPVYDWSGYYAGVTGGFAAGKARHPSQMDLFVEDTFLDLSNPADQAILDMVLPAFFDLCPCDIDYGAASHANGQWRLPLGGYLGDASASFSGAVAGAHVGHNWQSGSFVYGVEADLQIGKLEASHRSRTLVLGFLTDYVATTKVDWMGTLRGRVGWARGRFLAYGTGGIAYGHTTSEIGSFTNIGVMAYDSWTHGKGFRTGLVAGGGVEAGLSDRVSVRMEYLYTAFGSKALPSRHVASAPLALNIGFQSRVSMHTIRGGISIRF